MFRITALSALRILLRLGLVLLLSNTAQATTPTVRLATAGKSRVAVVTATSASPRTRAAADELAAYLSKISGATFARRDGDGKEGLAVGTIDDFPSLPKPRDGRRDDPTRREDYLLRTHARGAWLVGATELAVEHAVWDFLYRLGYRQFFPGPDWEIVPRVADLSIAVDTDEHPDYNARRIWYGNGAGKWSQPLYKDWCRRNRAVAGLDVRSGHAYDGILHRNRALFAEHPEYLGLIDGERRSTKFCISNPGLQQLVVDDALQQLAGDPSLQGVSVDPSDGGNWCQCAECAKLGSVSDRAVTLANAVAFAIQDAHSGKYAAMYAYNQHSPPPSIEVHPQVIVNVATAFISGGYSIEQLLAGWQRRGATVGIREYYSVHTWDRDLPGRSRGSNLGYLTQTIPHFHALGARFMSAESSDNWAPNGLGYYVAARMLWDVNEAARVQELTDDFFAKAFARSMEPMRRFYQLISPEKKPLLSDDLLGRMYASLDEARTLADDPGERARVNDLALYARYCELWHDFASTNGDARQQAWEALARHALRMRGSCMIHTVGLFRDLPRREKELMLPAEADPRRPDDKNPWLSAAATDDEIGALIEQGVARRRLLDFEPIAFSDDYVPATRLKLPNVPTGKMGLYSRGERVYHTWVDRAPTKFELTVHAGLIYGNRGPATIALFPRDEVEGKSVAEAMVAPDKQPHAIVLETAHAGTHRIVTSDHAAGTQLSWEDGTPMTVVVSPEVPTQLHGRWTLYFYVPKGTRTIGGFASGEGTLVDPDGAVVHKFPPRPDAYFSHPVPRGQDGKLWKFANTAGRRLLMTVPACLARNANELLLPREVVERDAAP